MFAADWETDVLVVQQSSGYCYDIEVKISRSDFKADLNKVKKHSILREGCYTWRRERWDREMKVYNLLETVEKHEFRPNRFYYCVPEELVSADEVPAYAGLMYVDQAGSVRTVKEAPFIHRQKLDFAEKLVNKLYIYWRQAEWERRLTSRNMDEADKDRYRLSQQVKELEGELKVFSRQA